MLACYKCAYKKCYYNNEVNIMKDYPRGLPDTFFFSCDKCNNMYHSEKCREEDFKSGHYLKCQKVKTARNELNRSNTNREFYSKRRSRKNSPEPDKFETTNKLAQFEILLEKDKCLGKGAFGYVTLVRNKKNMMVLAMKVISKKFVDNHGGREI